MGSSSSCVRISSSSSFSSLSIGRCRGSSSSLPLLFRRLRRSSSESPRSFFSSSPISLATLSPSSSSSSRRLYLAWSTRSIRPMTVAPPRLSTAKSVLRWSSYFSQANPRLLPVSLSRASLICTGSPYCEKIVTMSPSDRSNGRPPM